MMRTVPRGLPLRGEDAPLLLCDAAPLKTLVADNSPRGIDIRDVSRGLLDVAYGESKASCEAELD